MKKSAVILGMMFVVLGLLSCGAMAGEMFGPKKEAKKDAKAEGSQTKPEGSMKQEEGSMKHEEGSTENPKGEEHEEGSHMEGSH